MVKESACSTADSGSVMIGSGNHGPAAALALVDGLGAAACQAAGPGLPGYHLFHAIRADLLRRLGRADDAADAYDAALALTANAAEQAFLRHQRDQLAQPT